MIKINKLKMVCLLGIVCLSGCPWGAPPSKTPFGAEQGADGPFNQVANAFLHDIKAGRGKEAYDRTSMEYQKATKQDDFHNILKRNPFPQGAGTAFMGHGKADAPNQRHYIYRENLASGSIEFTFEVSKVEDTHQVTKFSMK